MFTLIIEDRFGSIVDEYSFEEGEFVIGRSQSCDIVLAADNVSRRHARLFTVEGRCYVEDLQAANGIWLNNKRLQNVTELPRSAQVRIGDFFLHIEGAAFSHPMGPASVGRLVALHGAGGGPYEVHRPTMLVGRGKDCAIVIHDPSVSRIHAKVSLEDGVVSVEDLRSSNGTWVNDRRVDRAEVRHGDRVRFGTVGFQFLVDGEAAPAPAPAWEPAPAPEPMRRAHASVISAVPDTPPESYAAAMSSEPAEGRSWVPQIAIVAVFALAATILVIVVGFAYDRLLAPALQQPPTPGAAQAERPAPAAKAQGEGDEPGKGADAAKDRRERFDSLLARGRDAIGQRQWDQAEDVFQEARRLDPIDDEPTRALNRIATEKRAGARFLQAEEAFKRRDYEEAIRHHRMIPDASVYFADAGAALRSLASIVELDGDKACAARDFETCKRLYALAMSTEQGSTALEKKYARVLEGDPEPPRRKGR